MKIREAAIVLCLAIIFTPDGVAQSTIDLPSTVTRSARSEGCEVFMNGRTMWIRSPLTTEFRELQLPEVMYTTALDIAVVDVEVSSNSKFVFIATNGSEGLFRFEIATSTWEPKRPPEASRSMSCVKRAPNGDIYAGCGGNLYNSVNNQTGVFLSTNNGETWSTVPIELSQGTLPGLAGIAVNTTGKMIFSGRKVPGSAGHGLYCQSSNGQWRNLLGSSPGRVLACGESFYSPEANFVHHIKYVDTNVTITSIRSLGFVQGIDTWNEDTLVILRSLTNVDSASLVRIVNGVVADESKTLEFLKGTSSPFVATSEAINGGIYIVGAGSWVYDWQAQSVSPITIEPTKAVIGRLYGCEQFAFVRVNQHGWHQVTSGTAVALVNAELAAKLDKSGSGSGVRYADKVVTHTNGVVYVVRINSVDSIAPTPENKSISYLALSDNESFLVVAQNDSLYEYNQSSKLWSNVSEIGRPKYELSGSDVLLGVDAVFYIDNTLYAWFRGGSYPTDHFESGGLYYQINNTWKRVPSNIPYRTTVLMQHSVIGTSGVFFCTETSSSGQVISQSIARLDNGGQSLLVETAEQYTVPSVSNVFAARHYVGWVTRYGSLYSWQSTSPIKIVDLRTFTSEASVLEDGTVLCTRDKGAIFFKNDNMVSSVLEASVSKKTTMGASMHSSATWSITLSGCQEQTHTVSLYNLRGTLLNSTSVSTRDGVGDIQSAPIILREPLLLIATAENGRCVHSVFVTP